MTRIGRNIAKTFQQAASVKKTPVAPSRLNGAVVQKPRGARGITTTIHLPTSWTPIVDRTQHVIDTTLKTVPQLQPGQQQAEPSAVLKLGELPNPGGKARAIVTFGVDPQELAQFAQEQNQRFDTARDVLDFSGERIHVVPGEVTANVPRLPLTHSMSNEEVSEYGASGMDVSEEGVKLQGLDYLMQMRPLHPTPDGGTTGWNTQQPHFHQGAELFHDQRLLHGVVPPGVTVILFHPHGAEVAPGGTFVAIKIDARAGHQFCTIHDALLELDPAMQTNLRRPGHREPTELGALHEFMDSHKVIPGLEFDSLTKADLARASALVVSSHTKDPVSTGEEGENLMADQTMGVANPEKFGTFLPWTEPQPVKR